MPRISLSRPPWWQRVLKSLGGLLLLLLLSALVLQLVLAGRILLMRWVNPSSTAFQRSEIVRLASTQGRVLWSQTWVDYSRISPHLKRAVLASEDAGFEAHAGFDLEAMELAWGRNQKAQAQAQSRASRTAAAPPAVKLRGGSTVTQQLAKNLFLSGERTHLRKAQELLITIWLEAFLPKRRILEIYLNHVEWGEGLFGAQAAARHYFGVNADSLDAAAAARLSVMLPAPKRFERRPASPYVLERAAIIQARMGAISLP